MLKIRRIKNDFEPRKKTFVFEIEDFCGIQKHIPIVADCYETALQILLESGNYEFEMGDLKRFDCLMPV